MDGDRTLLEKATKAAGLHLVWNSECACYMRTDCIGTVPWNPLKNDGDALRLATALELDITFNAFGDSEVMVSDSKDRFDGWFTEPYGTDKAAATRRAIVRAAAAIVKDPK